MAGADRELNQIASSLATAILDAGNLKGNERTSVGVTLERALKQFAEFVIQRSKEQPPGDTASP